MKFEAAVNENGKVKSSFSFWKDVNLQIPFLVEPLSFTIEPYSRAQFKVGKRTKSRNLEASHLISSPDMISIYMHHHLIIRNKYSFNTLRHTSDR